MAAPALRSAIWIVAAVVAALVVTVLASHGRRPDPGLVRFKPEGVMEVPPERVSEVMVSRGERRWRFRRMPEGWTGEGTAASSEGTAASLESGLRFLHVSAPQRVMAREELAGTALAELGLDPPRFSVSVRPGETEPITVEFGGLNPQGLARYARIRGHDEILLLPRFVAEPWERVVGGPP